VVVKNFDSYQDARYVRENKLQASENKVRGKHLKAKGNVGEKFT
jgi:hypothetical protein